MSISNIGHQTYSFGEFTLDVDRGALTSAGVDVKLRPKAFEVLCYLVERHGRLVSKDELLEAIWGQTVVTDDAVTQCLIDIRKAIKDRDQEKIRTVPRRGYIFELPVIANGGTDAASGEPFDSITNVGRRWQYAAMLVALLAAAFWWGLSTVGDRVPTVQGTVSSVESPSIAVLPFQDMSANQDQEYFADGMSEEILNLLTRVPELKVIARTSSFSFKGKSSDISEIAERLRVTHVLEGSVRKSNDSIRVTAQLVDASTSEHIWSETYDRTLNDVFALQDDIATMVVRELENRLLDRLPHSRRTDPQAYALFLRARSIARTGGSRPTINTAESLLRQALEIDPDYLPALSTLALVLFFQTSPNEDTTWSKYPRSEGEQLWKTALEAAYTSDPRDGEANVYFGWRRFMTESDAEGVRMTELAVASEPNNSEVLRVAGAFARYIGHWDASVALGQRAIDLDPLCQLCYWNLTMSYLYAGRLQEAENVAWKSITLFDQGWHILGTVLLLKGDAEAALRAYDELKADPIDRRQWRHGRALALYSLGRIKESRENLAEFIKSSGQHVSRHISASQVYAWIGDVDEAFKTLGNMSHPNENYFRHDFLAGAAWHPLYRNLHDDPRWQAYWELAETTPEELQSIAFDVNLPTR